MLISEHSHIFLFAISYSCFLNTEIFDPTKDNLLTWEFLPLINIPQIYIMSEIVEE